MNPFASFAVHVGRIVTVLAAESGASALDLSRIVVEPPRDESHGDLAINAAMVLSRDFKAKPRDLAERIAAKLRELPGVLGVEIAGPGFINVRLDAANWLQVLKSIVIEGKEFGRTGLGKAESVNVEYVSANPTGPMHIGHGRGAVFGDALASLLAFSGFKVTREYYVNDAGAQVDVLARSSFLRYREALGENIGAIPEPCAGRQGAS
jgi:arginyl-tRNA synthetase